MSLSVNFFELFGLPVRFSLDTKTLDAAYREVQSQVHPDRFADKSDAERRLSMQRATQANEAYQSLKKPLARAIYMLQLRGIDVRAGGTASIPNEFLMEQMEWREAVEEAKQGNDVHELENLRSRLEKDIDLDKRYVKLAAAFDNNDNTTAAALEVRKLMFLEKLRSDIDEALMALEDD